MAVRGTGSYAGLEVSLLRKCAVPGCGTRTLGEFCIDHEKPREEPDPQQPLTQPTRREAAATGLTVRLAKRERWRRTGSRYLDRALPPCRLGDGLFELWLGSCEGFRVIAADEPIGTVVRITRDAHGQPERLLVRAGLFRRTHRELTVAEVDSIVPETRRIHVTSLEPAGDGIANPRLVDDAR